MSEKFKSILSYSLALFNFLAGAASIISLVNSITTGILAVSFIVVFCLAFCICVAIIIYRALKPLSDKVDEISTGYIDISEKFASETIRLRECFHSGMDAKKFQREMLEGCHYLIAEIQKTLANTFGKKVRVCIKAYRNNTQDLLFTYCRDGLTADQSIKREHGQSIEIYKNSDFSNIVSGNQDIFIGNDLKKDFKQGKYHNTNKDFKYSSAVVVPIRALVNETENSARYDNVGFLCVDSKHKNMFQSQQSKMCIDLICSTAHLLYVFMTAGKEYYDSIVVASTKGDING